MGTSIFHRYVPLFLCFFSTHNDEAVHRHTPPDPPDSPSPRPLTQTHTLVISPRILPYLVLTAYIPRALPGGPHTPRRQPGCPILATPQRRCRERWWQGGR